MKQKHFTFGSWSPHQGLLCNNDQPQSLSIQHDLMSALNNTTFHTKISRQTNRYSTRHETHHTASIDRFLRQKTISILIILLKDNSIQNTNVSTHFCSKTTTHLSSTNCTAFYIFKNDMQVWIGFETCSNVNGQNSREDVNIKRVYNSAYYRQ